MSDYILGKLIKSQQMYSDFGDVQHRRFFALMRREYMVRFILAIMYDTYYSRCQIDEKAEITQMLFSTSRKPSLGVFKDAIQKLAMYAPTAAEKKKLKNVVTALSYNVIYNRNGEDHLLTADIDQVIEIIETWIKLVDDCGFSFYPSEVNKSGTEYDFLIPIKLVDGNSYRCACFKEGSEMALPVTVNKSLFHSICKRRVITGKLFYRVMESNGNISIYQLSPFIHYYDDPLRGIFTIYSHTLERSYRIKISARSIFDEQTGNSVDNDLLSGKICHCEIENDGFVDSSDNGNFFRSDYCEVNKSSYESFQRVTQGEFSYDEKIVNDKWKQLMSFCKNNNSPNCIIMGNGGIGKTAMLLCLVHKYMSGKMKNSIQRIIFLSAKKNSLEQDEKYNLSPVDVTGDITCFMDFRCRFFQYSLNLSSEEASNMKILENTLEEKEMLAQIEEDGRRLLLLLDDFDSLPPDEADKIYHFTLLLPPEKVKTIITTRDTNMVGAERIELTVFNKEQSCEFALWLFETKQMLGTWESRMKMPEYIEGLWQQTQGYPIFIMAWVEKACAGMPVSINTGRQIYSTKDCIEYLYGSILVHLKPEVHAVLFLAIKYIMCSKERVIDENILYYLSPVETREEMSEYLRQLIAYRLLRRNRIKPEKLELHDFDYNDIPITLAEKYKIYMEDGFFSKSIFKSLEENAQEWGDPHTDLNRIISYIRDKESLSWPESLFLRKLCDDVRGKKRPHLLSLNEMAEIEKMVEHRKRKVWEREDFENYIEGYRTDEYDAEKVMHILNKISNDRSSVHYKRALTMIMRMCELTLNDVTDKSEEEIVNLERTFPEIFSKVKELKDDKDLDMANLWKRLRQAWYIFNNEYT